MLHHSQRELRAIDCRIREAERARRQREEAPSLWEEAWALPERVLGGVADALAKTHADLSPRLGIKEGWSSQRGGWQSGGWPQSLVDRWACMSPRKRQAWGAASLHAGKHGGAPPAPEGRGRENGNDELERQRDEILSLSSRLSEGRSGSVGGEDKGGGDDGARDEAVSPSSAGSTPFPSPRPDWTTRRRTHESEEDDNYYTPARRPVSTTIPERRAL